MPLTIPQVEINLCDASQCVKVISSKVYGILKGIYPHPLNFQSPFQSSPPGYKMSKAEKLYKSQNTIQKYNCEKLKMLTAFFIPFKINLSLNFLKIFNLFMNTFLTIIACVIPWGVLEEDVQCNTLLYQLINVLK